MAPANPFHPDSRKHRAGQALLILALVLGTLGAAFFRTQVVRNGEFTLRADGNRFRILPIAAPRGTIYDRQGRVIAETVAGYALSAEPGPADSIRARVGRVRELLGLDSAAVEEIVSQAKASLLEPVLISDALTFAQVSRLQEQRAQRPGLILQPIPVRRYPYGAAVGHVVGYVGEISASELGSPAWAGYRAGQRVGKAGVERVYDRALGGTPGARYVEVDARGKLVGRFAEQATVQPKPGQDLRLTIDLDLQRYARQIFPAGKRGALVAMIPGTGEILALYSNPTFDANALTGRIRSDVWRALMTDPARPMLNRATHGAFPPGSTWKLATAAVALQRGIVTPQAKMPLPCTGGMSFAGRYARCDKRDGHGALNLLDAIAASCNVYFYQLGIHLGLDLLAREGTRLGFARRTGVDLPSERTGTFPTSRAWYKQRFGWAATPSEVMSLAIGQGPNDQTPLRMAQFYSALAGNGRAAVPHLLRTSKPWPVETDLGVSDSTLAALRVGLSRVVAEGGTAASVALERWALYGKTGTAENGQDPARPHAWFTGFAGPRGKAPEIVVVAFVEFGGHGGASAAPLAAKLADFYLNAKYGRPNPPLAPEPAELRAPARQ